MFVFRQRQRAENPPRRLRIFVKDAHLQNFLSFLKKTLDFPGGGRYNKTRSPARTSREYAPVAQLDRVSDYESEGRGFESLPAHQGHLHLQVTFFVYYSQVSPAKQVPRQLQTAGAFLNYILSDYLRLFQAVPKPTTPAQSSAASASSGKASPVRGRAPTGRAVFFMGRGIGAALGACVAVAAGVGES